MARPRKNEETTTPWVVRDVPEATRRKVRVYAAQHDLTIAQAVERLVGLALGETDERSRASAVETKSIDEKPDRRTRQTIVTSKGMVGKIWLRPGQPEIDLKAAALPGETEEETFSRIVVEYSRDSFLQMAHSGEWKDGEGNG
jgi:hypothetical protein